jgi:hypothetical protein
MDKHFTKTVLLQAGIEVAPWTTVTARQWAQSPTLVAERASSLGLPAFVKPARAGSSVGVSRITDWSQLAEAMEVALAEDDKVLIEEGIVGREVECGVLEGRDGAPTRVSVAGEVVMTDRAFYDFDAKYLDAPGIELGPRFDPVHNARKAPCPSGDSTPTGRSSIRTAINLINTLLPFVQIFTSHRIWTNIIVVECYIRIPTCGNRICGNALISFFTKRKRTVIV